MNTCAIKSKCHERDTLSLSGYIDNIFPFYLPIRITSFHISGNSESKREYTVQQFISLHIKFSCTCKAFKQYQRQ